MQFDCMTLFLNTKQTKVRFMVRFLMSTDPGLSIAQTGEEQI